MVLSGHCIPYVQCRTDDEADNETVHYLAVELYVKVARWLTDVRGFDVDQDVVETIIRAESPLLLVQLLYSRKDYVTRIYPMAVCAAAEIGSTWLAQMIVRDCTRRNIVLRRDMLPVRLSMERAARRGNADMVKALLAVTPPHFIPDTLPVALVEGGEGNGPLLYDLLMCVKEHKLCDVLRITFGKARSLCQVGLMKMVRAIEPAAIDFDPVVLAPPPTRIWCPVMIRLLVNDTPYPLLLFCIYTLNRNRDEFYPYSGGCRGNWDARATMGVL